MSHIFVSVWKYSVCVNSVFRLGVGQLFG